jgi:hypothetical protein
MSDDKFTGFDLGPVPEPKKDFTGFDLGPVGGTPQGVPSASSRGMLDNAPDDDMLSSTAKGVGTTIIKGLSHVPGMIGDLREGARYLGRRAVGAFTGETPEELEAKGDRLRKRAEDSGVAKAFSVIPSTDILPSGHDISTPILKQSGEYKPTTKLGRYAMDAGEAGLSMIAPGGALKSGVTKGAGFATAPAVDLAKSVLKSGTSPTMIGAGTVGGGAASIATDITGDPLYGMAAAPLAAGTASVAGSAAAKRFPSMREGARQDKAARIFKENVGDPEKVRTMRTDNDLGTRMTTAEAAGDTKLAKAESELEARDKGFAADLHAIRGEQEAARQQALSTLADPSASPMAIADAYIGQLNDLHTRLATETAAATAAAAQRRDAAISGSNTAFERTQNALDNRVRAAQEGIEQNPLPGTVDRSARGDNMREIVEGRDSALGAEVTRLYNAVDPDGALNVVSQGAADGARRMLQEFDPSVELATGAAPIIQMVADLPPVMSFGALAKLDKTITAKMADFKNSDRVAHGQMVALKDLVQSDLRNALQNQMAWEARAVEAGTMQVDQTIGARLAADAQEYMADARARTRTGTGDDAAMGAPGVSRATGPEGEGGPGVRPGDERVPNFTPEDLERYNAAKQRHIDRVTTYRQGPVGDALKTTGFAGDFKQPGSRVAANIFRKGPEGVENLNAWLRAAGDDPQALSIVQDLASSTLVDAAKDGLTPARLAAWKRDYGPALARIDEVVPGFSSRFDNVATAAQAMEDASTAQTAGMRQAMRDRETAVREAEREHTTTLTQRAREEAGAVRDFERNAGNFLRRDNAEDIVREVGSVLQSRDSATRMQRLLDDIGADPNALEGLRKATSQWLIDNYSNMGISDSGARKLSGKLAPFIEQRATTLRRLYGDEGYGQLTRLAEDIDRGVQHVNRKAAPVGSDTAPKIAALLDGLAKQGMDNTTWGFMFAAPVAHAIFDGNWASALGAMGLLLDRSAGGAMRTASQKRVQRILAEAMADPVKGKALMQRALDAEGRPNVQALAPFLTVLRAEQSDDDRRRERASGGRLVNAIDHAAEAARYVRLAARAKNAHSEKTKEFLNVPDATVAKALAVAHEAI